MKRSFRIGLLLAAWMGACVSFAADELDWQQANGPINEHGYHDPVRNIYPHPTKPGAACVQIGSRMYRTDDYGESWESFGPRRGRNVSEIVFHPHKPGTIFARLDDSLWTSDDDGEKWRRAYRRRGEPLMAVMFHETDKETTYCLHKSVLLTTKDGGETWTEEALAVADDVLCATRSGKPLAIDYETKDERTVIGKSGDRPITRNVRRQTFRALVPGEEPRKITPEGERFNAMVVCFEDSTRLATATHHAMFLSTDAGRSWRKTEKPDISHITWVVFNPRHKDRLLMATTGKGMFEYDFASKRLSVIGDTVFPSSATCCAVGGDGKTYWAGTTSAGVWVYSPDVKWKPNDGPDEGVVDTTPSRPEVPDSADDAKTKWKLANGPYGGTVDEIAIHPKNPHIILAGNPGMMRSEDEGDSWKAIKVVRGWPFADVRAIAFSRSEPDTVYAFLSYDFYASHDAGKTWRRTDRIRLQPNRIAVDPFEPKRVFLYSTSRGLGGGVSIQISEDGGRIFNPATEFPLGGVWRFKCDPNHKGVAHCHNIQDDDKLIAISRDHGENWAKIPSPLGWKKETLIRYGLDPEDESLLLAHTISRESGKDLHWFRYEDSEDWEIYYSEESGIKMTDETKATLERTFPPRIEPPDGNPNSRKYLTVAPSDPNIGFFIKDFLRRTHDGGKTWEDISTDLPGNHIATVYAHPTKPDSAFCSSEAGLFRTDDLGASWKRLGTGARLYFHPLKPDVYFIRTGDQLSMAEEDGKKVRAIFNGFVSQVVFDPENPEKFYCYRHDTLHMTTDGGETWKRKPLGEKFPTRKHIAGGGGGPLVLSYGKDNELHLFVPGQEKKVLDIGNIAKKKASLRIDGAAISPTDSSFLVLFSYRELYYSVDMGKTWRNKSPPAEISAVTFHPRNKNELFIASLRDGIWKFHLDTGETIQVAEAPPRITVQHFAVSLDGKTLWVSAGTEGVWVHRAE